MRTVEQRLPSLRHQIRKEACWAVSNISAGSATQIQTLIDANLFPVIIERLSTGDFDVRKEALWALSNATEGGTQDQVAYLVESGAIPGLCSMLDCPDSRLTIVALDGLNNVLRHGARIADGTGASPWVNLVEECGGLDKLEAAQSHEDHAVYERAVRVVCWLV